MKNIKYVVYREDKYYVAQCLNVEVSSFGTTLDAAVANLNVILIVKLIFVVVVAVMSRIPASKFPGDGKFLPDRRYNYEMD